MKVFFIILTANLSFALALNQIETVLRRIDFSDVNDPWEVIGNFFIEVDAAVAAEIAGAPGHHHARQHPAPVALLADQATPAVTLGG